MEEQEGIDYHKPEQQRSTTKTERQNLDECDLSNVS